MSTLLDWKIRDIERGVEDCKRQISRVHSLESDLESLKVSARMIESSVGELRHELRETREEVGRLQEQIRELGHPI
jgi:chromosome segregation ATPase